MSSQSCTIESCGRPVQARGLCHMHYQRWRLYGNPHYSKLRDPSIAAQRFWGQVDKRGDDECWIWQGPTNGSGYGSFSSSVYGSTSAHRHSYQVANGPLLPGMVVDHMCRRRACVNPAHLQAVTQKQNCEHKEASPRSVTGIRGVAPSGRKAKPWQVYVTTNGKRAYSGRFATLEEAESAVIEARRRIFTNSILDQENTPSRRHGVIRTWQAKEKS